MNECCEWVKRLRKRRAFADPELDRLNEKALIDLHNCESRLIFNPSPINSSIDSFSSNSHYFNDNPFHKLPLNLSQMDDANNLNQPEPQSTKPLLNFSIDVILGKL